MHRHGVSARRGAFKKVNRTAGVADRFSLVNTQRPSLGERIGDATDGSGADPGNRHNQQIAASDIGSVGITQGQNAARGGLARVFPGLDNGRVSHKKRSPALTGLRSVLLMNSLTNF